MKRAVIPFEVQYEDGVEVSYDAKLENAAREKAFYYLMTNEEKIGKERVPWRSGDVSQPLKKDRREENPVTDQGGDDLVLREERREDTHGVVEKNEKEESQISGRDLRNEDIAFHESKSDEKKA
jgi:hypothetical protein